MARAVRRWPCQTHLGSVCFALEHGHETQTAYPETHGPSTLRHDPCAVLLHAALLLRPAGSAGTRQARPVTHGGEARIGTARAPPGERPNRQGERGGASERGGHGCGAIKQRDAVDAAGSPGLDRRGDCSPGRAHARRAPLSPRPARRLGPGEPRPHERRGGRNASPADPALPGGRPGPRSRPGQVPVAPGPRGRAPTVPGHACVACVLRGEGRCVPAARAPPLAPGRGGCRPRAAQPGRRTRHAPRPPPPPRQPQPSVAVLLPHAPRRVVA